MEEKQKISNSIGNYHIINYLRPPQNKDDIYMINEKEDIHITKK